LWLAAEKTRFGNVTSLMVEGRRRGEASFLLGGCGAAVALFYAPKDSGRT